MATQDPVDIKSEDSQAVLKAISSLEIYILKDSLRSKIETIGRKIVKCCLTFPDNSFDITCVIKEVLLKGAGAYIWPFLQRRESWKFVLLVSKSMRAAEVHGGELLKCFRLENLNCFFNCLDVLQITDAFGRPLALISNIEIMRMMEFFLYDFLKPKTFHHLRLSHTRISVLCISLPKLGKLVLSVKEDDKKGLLLEVKSEKNNMKITCKAWKCSGCDDGVAALACTYCDDPKQCTFDIVKTQLPVMAVSLPYLIPI